MSIPFIDYFVHDVKTLFQQNSTNTPSERDVRIASIGIRIVGVFGLIIATSTLLYAFSNNEKNPLLKLFECAFFGVFSYDFCVMGHNISKYVNQNIFGRTMTQINTHSTRAIDINTQNTILLRYFAVLF